MNILLIAKAFLNKESMSHKKLQKLCYYFYSWDIALEGVENKKIKSSFQAWVHGPVSPFLYQEYKRYGWEDIPKEDVCPNEINGNNYTNELINQVYRIYGSSTGNELEQLTHEEKPWLSARGNLKPYESSEETLDDYVILDFYKKELSS